MTKTSKDNKNQTKVTKENIASDKTVNEKKLKKDIQIINDNLDKLERALVCADENGLFKEATVIKDGKKGEQSPEVPKYEEIFENLSQAIKTIKNEKLGTQRVHTAWEKFRLANHQYYQVLNNADFSWRFKYRYGGPFIVYFFTLLGVSFLAWYYGGFSSKTQILLVPLYAYFWGLVGGVLQGFWFLWQHVNDRKMRKAWIPWYLLLPFMGALLGAMMYLVFSAGFIAATGESAIKSESIVMLLSALAGFSTRWAVESIDKLTKLIRISK